MEYSFEGNEKFAEALISGNPEFQRTAEVINECVAMAQRLKTITALIPVHKKRIFPRYDRTPKKRAVKKAAHIAIAYEVLMGAQRVSALLYQPIPRHLSYSPESSVVQHPATWPVEIKFAEDFA